jgi:hypothetical protein
MSIVLQGSTSGSVTLQEPAVAGTTVLDLPAVSGTVLTTTSPKAGNILQVVQGTATAPVVTTSTTYITTGLSVSITPSSASSRILVIASACFRKGNSNVLGPSIAIFRDSTNVYTGVLNQFYMTVSSGEPSSILSLNYVDSPSTTSAITYSLRFKTLTASNTVVSLPDSETGTIIAMEIAG